ncbi:MAG: tetratricopeptide repeat protein [Pirellulaceae bacterium]|nr:tetratricopeptide repeat protein [Pirellulaceae bacterium]
MGPCLLLAMLPLSIGCATLLPGPRTEEITAARQMSIRGVDAMQRGQWDEAEGLFNQAIAKCPVDERARCHYAETLWHRGAHGDAIAQMREAVRLSGGSAALSLRLGEMYLEQGNLRQAARYADEAVAQRAELPRAWALHGDVLARQGKAEEALASYHRALSYQDHFPRVQLAVSEIYRQQQRPDRALGTLTALADQYPPGQIPPEVFWQRGLALKDLRRFDDAVEYLAEANRLGLASADLLFHLSEAQLLAGDPLSAQRVVLQALQQAPEHRGAQQLHDYLGRRQPGLTAGLHDTRRPGL